MHSSTTFYPEGKWEVTMPAPRELLGHKFNRLTVVAFVGHKGGRRRWECRCDCGKLTVVGAGNLVTGKVASCGCGRGGKLIHGHNRRGKRSTEYTIYNTILQRCYNPRNAKFTRYGARGIIVCDRWKSSFEAFVQDMGFRPAGMSIDRVDNDGNYEPSNCRWATALEQRHNRSDSRKAA